MRDSDSNAALGGAVQLGQHRAGHFHRFAEEPRLDEAVLAGGGVDGKQGFMGAAGYLLGDNPADLLELLHQINLGMQAAGGVDDYHVDTA